MIGLVSYNKIVSHPLLLQKALQARLNAALDSHHENSFHFCPKKQHVDGNHF